MKIERQKYSMDEVYNWDNYIKQGHSTTETSTYFNVPYKSMLNLLNRHGLRIPTRHTPAHRINPDMIKYFDQINSHKKAYFLGLLYADGYICKSNYNYQMGIALQLQDKYIIEELHKELNLKTKLNIYKNSAKLVISDDYLCKSLNNLGIQEDKSHKEFGLPPIKKKFMRSFLLGYFDGDGCITNSTIYPKINICCNSKQFLSEVQEYLSDCAINSTIHSYPRKNNPIYILDINKLESKKRFAQLIYRKSPIYLFRKYDKFIKYNLITLPCN